MTFDSGHSHIGSKKGKRNIRFIRELGQYIGHLHISDNKGKKDDHIPIGKGNINFLEIIRELKKINYNDTVTFEIFTEDRQDLVRSRELFKSMILS